MGKPLSWLYNNPSVEEAKAFIRNHRHDELLGMNDGYGGITVPLHKAIQDHASDDVILLLLEACPQAAAAKDDFKRLPLHGAINGYCGRMFSEKIIKALLNAHPGAASERDPPRDPHARGGGNLPLHDAVNKNASDGIILSLLNAYPQAAAEEMKNGRLIFEIYLKRERRATVEFMREICNVRIDGLLLLGVVLTKTKRSSDDIVLAVLEADPEAAGKRFSTKFDECILPLHIAYEDEHSEPVKDALRRAYPDAENENPFGTTHQLHKYLESEYEQFDHEDDLDHVIDMCKTYPEAAGKRGRDGRLPLHIAIDRMVPGNITEGLFYTYPQAGKEKMKDGRLPIEVFAEQKVTDRWPQSHLTGMAKLLLGNDMPVSVKDGTPKEHSGSWHICISYSTETATSALREVLLEPENISGYDSDDIEVYFRCGFGKHIHALADACDYQGRTALGLASKESREVIHEFLLFCGRYKPQIGPPEHRSATSVVLRARDLGEQADYGAIFDEADEVKDGKLDRKELKAITVKIGLNPDLFLKGSDESTISKEEFVGICERQLGDGEVVIKLMQKKDHWERELKARNDFDLNPKYVVSALSNVPSDTEIANAVKEGKGGLKTIQDKFLKDIVLGKYAIVMGAGPRNLLQIYHQEQPNTDAVRDMLTQVFKAVKHLHEKKLMHGDIKMLNIIRLGIDNKLRLIDFDASARIVPSGGEEESFAGASAKFSSAILPPEMIERIETEEQLEKFKKYWESEIDEDLTKKVEPKLYKKQGTVKARYVVKSFRTEEGKPTTPVFEGLPYEDEELVHASENIDVWSLGVLAFTLLTGEPLIPSNREDDCLSGTAMHLLKSWGTQPEVLTDSFKKIQNDAARDLVWKLLQRDPAKRPTVASLLENHPFFHPELSAGTEDQFRDMKEYLQNITNQVETIHRNILVIKELSHKSQSELLRTRRVLLKGIFEATEVRTPTTFIILNNKLPPEPSDVDKNKILKIIAKEDGSGVCAKTEYATFTATEEGVGIDLEGDLKEYRDKVEDGIKWAKAIKNIGTNFAAGNIDEAFVNIKDGIKDLIVGNEMYLYLIDDLTGDPVQAEGWPLVITTPSDVVPKLLPLMQLGMIGLSFYNGTAGLVRMFGYPAPKVPKEWSKGAQETVELLKQESSVEEFSVLHEEVKEGSGEKKSVRGESLRIFMDFLEKEDPGLKDGKNGHFAGLQRFGDDQGTALWTVLTNKKEIEDALQERTKQFEEEEERTQNERNRQQNETHEEILETEEVPTLTSEEMNTNQTTNTPISVEIDTRNNVVASEEIVELTKAAKETTASAKEAIAAAKEATAAATAATAAAKEAACCTIL
eukprot:scaffold3377_cov69-Skeletonema_dohrnii-CCMP3373.AAC.1